MIRGSWGRPNIPAVTTRLAFMLGMPSEAGQQRELDRAVWSTLIGLGLWRLCSDWIIMDHDVADASSLMP